MAYIDKELFKQDIKMRYCNNCARPNDIKCRACHVDDMLGEIEDAPTADVVEIKQIEIIRDDLKWWLKTNTEKGVVYIPKFVVENMIAKMDGGKTE